MKDKIYTKEQTIAMLEVISEVIADYDKFDFTECAILHAIEYLKEK